MNQLNSKLTWSVQWLCPILLYTYPGSVVFNDHEEKRSRVHIINHSLTESGWSPYSKCQWRLGAHSANVQMKSMEYFHHKSQGHGKKVQKMLFYTVICSAQGNRHFNEMAPIIDRKELQETTTMESGDCILYHYFDNIMKPLCHMQLWVYKLEFVFFKMWVISRCRLNWMWLNYFLNSSS